jgi:hypothetical protein
MGMAVEALRLGLKRDQSEQSVYEDAIVVPTIESRLAGDPLSPLPIVTILSSTMVNTRQIENSGGGGPSTLRRCLVSI